MDTAERDARQADREAHANAVQAFCPRCHAEPGTMCVGTITGARMRACHWQRLRQASSQASDTEPE